MAKKKTFEIALKELEGIVKEMESGDLSLEEAVKKYELGIKQSKFCLDLLDKTEKKIAHLTRDDENNSKQAKIEDKQSENNHN